MKRTCFLLLSFLLMPIHVLAVSNLRLNGSTEHTVTSLPAEVVVTCDLSAVGNSVEVGMYLDINASGTLDDDDMLVEFLILTDGIGWIRDPENPDEDIAGDETPVDGTLQSTASIEEDDEVFFAGQFIIQLTDEDGSTATALLMFDIEPQPPLIMGKVTDAASGTSIENIVVVAERDVGEEYPETGYGITDANGDYFVSVTPGAWRVVATDFVGMEYMSSDTMDVTISEGETKTLNFQLRKYDSFVAGETQKEDGTAVPGIRIWANNIDSYTYSMGNSDNRGYYRLGVEPGRVAVMANALLNMLSPESAWPGDHYVEPASDTVTVERGETARADFVFKPYTAFIEGDCTVGSEGLANVQITAMSVDFHTGEFNMSFALSDEEGHYRIGVIPRIVSMLTAYVDGYDLTSPIGGYMGITINPDETITGKDFLFTRVSGEMSVGGHVSYLTGDPASGVYVVAILDEEDSPSGYRIAYTDAAGAYQFDELMEGSWKVGVYTSGYASTPPMRYELVIPGTIITDADFVLGTPTAISPDNTHAAPREFHLAQNYPNPFNPTTHIRYTLPTGERRTENGARTTPPHVSLKIYNILGQEVRMLVDEPQGPGYYTVTWDGTDQYGNDGTSGVYFCRLSAAGGEWSKTRRMLLLR